MKLERTVLWAEKDLFLEDGNLDYGFLGFVRGCFYEDGIQVDGSLPPETRAAYEDVIHFLCSSDAKCILKGKIQMEGYCRNRMKSHVSFSFGRECWGFRVLNDDFAWYLACTPWNDRKQFSLFVYDRTRLMTALAAERGLPEKCFGVQPFTGERIEVRFGEDVFELFPQFGGNAVENKRYADERNAELGVSAPQVAAMINGSIFGWDTPMADPTNYDKDGHYNPSEKQSKGEKRR